MRIGAVARQYAQALFAVALEQKALDKVEQELHQVVATITANRDLTQVWRHPQIRAEDKVKLINELSRNALAPITLNFIRLLAQKDREAVVGEVLAAYRELLRSYKGILVVEITAARALEQAQRTRLVSKLMAKYAKVIQLTETIDPSLLGGMVIRIGDQVMDGSIRRRLEQIREKLG